MSNESLMPNSTLTNGCQKFKITESNPVAYNNTIGVLQLKMLVNSDLEENPEVEVAINLAINNVMPNTYTQMMLNAIKSGALMPDYEGKYVNEYLVGLTGTVYLSKNTGVWGTSNWQFDGPSYLEKLGVW